MFIHFSSKALIIFSLIQGKHHSSSSPSHWEERYTIMWKILKTTLVLFRPQVDSLVDGEINVVGSYQHYYFDRIEGIVEKIFLVFHEVFVSALCTYMHVFMYVPDRCIKVFSGGDC